ncbi:MAG: hypothetical protein RIQ72_157 [Candidatus Parcubacteria bacterium]|jgi:hypothetical protein
MRKIILIPFIISICIGLVYLYKKPIIGILDNVTLTINRIYQSIEQIPQEKKRLQADAIRKKIDVLKYQGRKCTVDSDCIAIPSMGPCSSGLTSFNKNADIEKIKSLYQDMYDVYPVTYSCLPLSRPPGTPQPACIKNSCELTYTTETK